jgi:hypothetical protein
MHGRGILANEVFWGLWLFPFGLASVQIAVPCAHPRHLADAQLLLLFGYERTGMLRPPYEQRVSNCVFPAVGRTSHHTVDPPRVLLG